MTEETKTSDETKPADARNPAAAAAPDGSPEPAPAAEGAGGFEDGPTVEDLQAELNTMRERLLRAVADSDNIRKRSEREAADARTYAVTSFARDLLSVSDNLGRALAALTPEIRAGLGDAAATLVDGVEITQRELLAALTRHGVKSVPAGPGSPFDPNLHQAAAQIPSEHPPGSIVTVFQDGWTIGDRTLRAAVVTVSSGPARSAPSDSAADASS